MRHGYLRRGSAAVLCVLAITAAHAQSAKVWPLDPATLPGAITGIPAGTGWPSPPLGPGPFLIESVRPEHRNLRVVVVARGLEQRYFYIDPANRAAQALSRKIRCELVQASVDIDFR